MSENNLDREIEEGLARADAMLRRERNQRILYVVLGLCALVGAFFIGFLSNRSAGSALPMASSGLYFSSNRSGKFEIYHLGQNSQIEQITHTVAGQSWGPALSPTGVMYFTSNRDGKKEIYAMTNGVSVRITTSPANSNSWNPIPTLGGMYFVSNRSGKNEIYFLSAAGETFQVTSGSGESQFSIGE
jgi:hypothetical protein